MKYTQNLPEEINSLNIIPLTLFIKNSIFNFDF